MNGPCDQCPFRRASVKGWLGESSYKPEEFLATIEHAPIACHAKIDWANKEQVSEFRKRAWVDPCIGSLDFMRNIFKLPRDDKYKKLLTISGSRNSQIFDLRQDFINHHTKK